MNCICVEYTVESGINAEETEVGTTAVSIELNGRTKIRRFFKSRTLCKCVSGRS